VSELHPGMPVVTTNHGPFNDDLIDIYGRVAERIPLIAISAHQASTAPPSVPVEEVIHHGLDLARYPFGAEGGGYLLSLGRMNHDKGIDRAIEVARRAGLPLLIAAKMREAGEQQYFTEVIEPKLGDDVRYVGDHERKIELLLGARALLNPIRWPEPFGLVMIEALACGTPVVATNEGAAPEIVVQGETGFLADTTDDLVAAVIGAGGLSRLRCRARAETRFSAKRMVADHVELYRRVLDRASVAAGTFAAGPLAYGPREPAALSLPARAPLQPVGKAPLQPVGRAPLQPVGKGPLQPIGKVGPRPDQL
jgi:glycosyltransferase involved in cell wall biosynthesis